MPSKKPTKSRRVETDRLLDLLVMQIIHLHRSGHGFGGGPFSKPSPIPMASCTADICRTVAAIEQLT